ncbi:MAG: 2-hydroxyacyl-CoA dehydratase family protein [Bacillota bacterium]
MTVKEQFDGLKAEAAKAMYQLTLAEVPELVAVRRPLVFSVDSQLFPEISIAANLTVDNLILLGGIGIMGPQSQINAKIDKVTDFGIESRACNAIRLAQYNILSGILPVPDALVLVNSACDGMNALSRIAESYKPWSKVPRFIVNVPYGTDDEDFVYLGEQLKKLNAFLETVTGKKTDSQRLHEISVESNKQLQLMLELQELKRARPFPLDFTVLNMTWALKSWVASTKPSLYPWITDWLERALLAGENAYRAGKGLEGISEKIRFLWYDATPAWSSELFPRLTQELGAVCVSNYYTNFYDIPLDLSSVDSFYTSAAKKYVLATPMIRQSLHSADLYCEDLLKSVRDYKCDAVLLGHVGHRTQNAMSQLAREMCQRNNIPFECIGQENFDDRYMSPDAVFDKFKTLFEVTGLTK